MVPLLDTLRVCREEGVPVYFMDFIRSDALKEVVQSPHTENCVHVYALCVSSLDEVKSYFSGLTRLSIIPNVNTHAVYACVRWDLAWTKSRMHTPLVRACVRAPLE